MNDTTVTTPNDLEIRVERVFDAPRAHVFSVLTDPQLIPEWWGDGTVVEEMDVRPGGRWRFRTAYGVVEGEYREVEAPQRLVQTFQNHLQTIEFEDLGDRTKLTQTMRFDTTEERDTDDAVRRRGGCEGRVRAHRRSAEEDRGLGSTSPGERRAAHPQATRRRCPRGGPSMPRLRNVEERDRPPRLRADPMARRRAQRRAAGASDAALDI